jgi:Spx/MgsR family transcriptional regulator
MVLYGISNCDTVKRARAWLAVHKVVHDFHDFKKSGVPAERLDAWMAAIGWQHLLNRQGATWRKLDGQTQRSVIDAASARALMLAQPSVIRRPVIEWTGGGITIGFDAERWLALLERH